MDINFTASIDDGIVVKAVADHITYNGLDYSQIAQEIDTEAVAKYVDETEIGRQLDYYALSSEIDYGSLASEIDTQQVAEYVVQELDHHELVDSVTEDLAETILSGGYPTTRLMDELVNDRRFTEQVKDAVRAEMPREPQHHTAAREAIAGAVAEGVEQRVSMLEDKVNELVGLLEAVRFTFVCGDPITLIERHPVL